VHPSVPSGTPCLTQRLQCIAVLASICNSLKIKCPPQTFHWTPGPKLVALFWKVVESLGCGTLLEKGSHWGCAFGCYTWPLLPYCLCFLFIMRWTVSATSFLHHEATVFLPNYGPRHQQIQGVWTEIWNLNQNKSFLLLSWSIMYLVHSTGKLCNTVAQWVCVRKLKAGQ
jgi:hypothetical protein